MQRRDRDHAELLLLVSRTEKPGNDIVLQLRRGASGEARKNIIFSNFGNPNHPVSPIEELEPAHVMFRFRVKEAEVSYVH